MRHRTAALMVLGTGSDVGKSTIVAALARAFVRRGLAVRPFKPQNMANNAAVTLDGGEIGRAQAVQARAACTPPSVHMNPVLLKPETDTVAQVVVRGRIAGRLLAGDLKSRATRFLPEVLASFAHLEREADLVLVEGAGSPAEINLREGHIANMGFACAAGLPAVMVGDIDRGGVIASLVGTHAVLPPDERRLIKGFMINRLVVLPGSKSTVSDLAFLRAQGWHVDLVRHARRGGRLIGLCGGYQMLGRTVSDPAGLEGPRGTVEGLGLLDVETVLEPAKTTRMAKGRHLRTGTSVTGYEIHQGRTTGPDGKRPFLELDGRPEGATSEDGRVSGTYLHGIFAADGFRSAFLAGFGLAADTRYEARLEASLNALAAQVERELDLDAILSIARARSGADAAPAHERA